MEKIELQHIGYEIEAYIQEKARKGIMINLNLYNLLAIADELGYIRKEPISKQIEMEEKGGVYYAKADSKG